MKKLLKFLKWTGISVIILLVIAVVGIWFISEKEPIGQTGPAAEAMTQRMFTAINKPAWDSTEYVQWTFKSMHTFLWDKKRHLTQVTWDDTEVLLDINKIDGFAKKNGILLSGEAAEKVIKSAWEYWCNDSFWLNAPAKAMDAGTTRSIVNLADGREGLKVQYASGGATPGDAYVWILDENGLPISYRMWVKIIPIGGAEFSWDQWKTLKTGAKIAAFHEGLLDLDISDLKGGMNFTEMGLTSDPFEVLEGLKD